MFEIDRNIVVIKAREPFLQWINALPGSEGEVSFADLRCDCTTYLVPVSEDPEHILEYVYERFAEVFEGELESWTPDANLWPQERGLEVFKRWFTLEYHSVIYDMVDEEVEDEMDDFFD